MDSGPLILGLTGGIATGKSTCVRMLRELLPETVVFDSDACVRRLYSEPAVLRALRRHFGPEALCADGNANKGYLRKRAFSSVADQRFLEQTFHPRVREDCLALLAQTATKGASRLFVADVPLLFENGFTFGQSANLLVATGRKTQVERLTRRNKWDPGTVQAVLASQMPIEAKHNLADVVLWNEGPPEILRKQCFRLLRSLHLLTESTESPPLPMNDETEANELGHKTTPAPPATDPAAPEKEPAAVLPDLPKEVVVNELRERPLSEIYSMLEALPVKIPAKASKSQLVFELLSFYGREGVELEGEGVLEQAKDNYAMLRDPAKSFKTSPDDLYISGNLIREHGLLAGQKVKVKLRSPKGRDKYISASEVLEVEGMPVAEYQKPKSFDQLTAMFPDQRIILENKETGMTPRVLDLVAPLGKGQRGLIVAPPRGGKTIVLKQIAKSIQLNHPEVELIILLLDERPEEVTDFEETVQAEVFSSTFDEPAKRHAQVSDLVMERAKRLVELGKDVVLLLDSLTRLARGHNTAQRNGPIGSGGLSPAALQQSRKFFGAARNCEEGGSLTILATALIETESKMDEVIFEEFKGTGNMEVRLDRELAEQRIYPAIHIPQSGTRNDDRLYHPDEMAKVLEIRRQLASLPIGEAIETLLKNLAKTGTNAELLLSGLHIGR